jgi:hypothetical protein
MIYNKKTHNRLKREKRSRTGRRVVFVGNEAGASEGRYEDKDSILSWGPSSLEVTFGMSVVIVVERDQVVVDVADHSDQDLSPSLS